MMSRRSHFQTGTVAVLGVMVCRLATAIPIFDAPGDAVWSDSGPPVADGVAWGGINLSITELRKFKVKAFHLKALTNVLQWQ